jgi:hypothetical protein
MYLQHNLNWPLPPIRARFLVLAIAVWWLPSFASTVLGNPDEVDVSRLRALEDRDLPPALVEGPPSQPDLPSYYLAANPQLKQRFDEARRRYELPQGDAYRAVTLVAGAAGVGKTFLKGEVFSRDYPPSAVCRFDIRELYTEFEAQHLATAKPDLCDGDVVLNELLSSSVPEKYLVGHFLAEQDAEFYVIDSLDEIHPDDYVSVLEQIEDFVFRGDRRFVHVVVFGRALAFRDYWRARRPRASADQVALFMLAPPKFRTTGDLLVSSWNYHSWKYKLRWASPGGEPEPFSLQDYGSWVEAGFPRQGRFASVTCKQPENIALPVHEMLLDWARQHRVVCGTLYNLAGNSMAREIAETWVQQGKTYRERAFMDAYFQRWLERDTQSDGRPSATKPEYLDLYMQLLEQLAVKYLQEEKIDDHGFFVVRDEDAIEVDYEGRSLRFPVKRILNRSGLKYLDPRQAGPPAYRFEPIWFHRLLVESHQQRTSRLVTSQSVTVQP